jgi:aspartate/methionine/tyrosine aminotransferase
VLPVADTPEFPEFPHARSASAQNSAGRASAGIPDAHLAVDTQSRNQSDVSCVPQEEVIPASGAPPSI